MSDARKLCGCLDILRWCLLQDVKRLQAATTATTLAAGRVSRDRGNILDAANLHAGTGEGAESRLGARARGLGLVAAGGAHLNVERRDADLLAARSNVLRGKHGSVRGGLVAVSLDLHTTGDAAESFAARQIGHVDEGVVEGSEDVRNSEHLLSLRDLGPEAGYFFFFIVRHFKIVGWAVRAMVKVLFATIAPLITMMAEFS